MNAVIYLPYIFKHCSKCGELLPATHLFFAIRCSKKEKLRADCRTCNALTSSAYYLTHKAERKAYFAGWYQENMQKVINSANEWKKANPGRVKDIRARSRAKNKPRHLEYNRKYYEMNKEKISSRMSIWWANNRVKRKAYKQQRRARKVAAPLGLPFDEQAQLKRQKGKCYYCDCKLDKYHVDHVIPLSRGGSDGAENKVLACPTCNLHKSNKMPHEWLEGGRLL